MMVFEALKEETSACALQQQVVLHEWREKQIQSYDFTRDEASLPLMSLKKIGKTWRFMRTLS